MSIDIQTTAAAVIALVLFAHAWNGRMTGPPVLLSVIGWVVNVLAALALLAIWVT
jgi:hypothetical protein